MLSSYNRRGPSTPLVMVSAIALVLTCVLIYTYGFRFLQAAQRDNAAATRVADEATLTQSSNFFLGPSPTPVPDCQMFEVSVSAAMLRTCPDTTCQRRDIREFQDPVCVYSVAEASEQYPLAAEWYIIDINPDGAFRDLAYMHSSTVRPLNPTPRPSATFTPLPTVTLTPTFRGSPLATTTLTPTPYPTLGRTEF